MTRELLKWKPEAKQLAMGRLMAGVFLLTCGLILAACSSDDAPGDGFITFDNFTGSSISTTKWIEDTGAGGSVSIVNNAFQAKLNADGSLPNNNAFIRMAAAGSPGSVTGLEVTMKVSQFTQTNGGIRARMLGSFYNDGTVPGGAAGSDTSDILGIMQMANFAGTTGNADYVVVRCTNADCTTNVLVTSGTFGTVQLSVDHTFRMVFDSSTSTFTFTMDSGTPVTVDAGGLGAVFSASPNFPSVHIGIRGNNLPDGTMTATFDDFRCRGCTLP